MTGDSNQTISEHGVKVDEHALLGPFMPNTLLQRIRETLDKTLTT